MRMIRRSLYQIYAGGISTLRTGGSSKTTFCSYDTFFELSELERSIITTKAFLFRPLYNFPLFKNRTPAATELPHAVRDYYYYYNVPCDGLTWQSVAKEDEYVVIENYRV